MKRNQALIMCLMCLALNAGAKPLVEKREGDLSDKKLSSKYEAFHKKVSEKKGIAQNHWKASRILEWFHDELATKNEPFEPEIKPLFATRTDTLDIICAYYKSVGDCKAVRMYCMNTDCP